MAIEITARKRETQGTGAARRLRRQGRVPGIVYGGDQGALNIELDHKDLYLNLRNERFHASILTLEVAGSKEQVLLRSVSMHPYRPQVQHVDFQRVLKDRKLHMKVPLHFTNAEKSPGVKDQGGVVSHVLNELDITCFPADLPEFIEVDLGNLAVGNSVHARDLALPKGVELAIKKDENSPAIEPNEETVVKGKYPLWRYLYVYVNPAIDKGDIAAYLNWIRSDEGQKIVKEVGYFPLPAHLRE